MVNLFDADSRFAWDFVPRTADRYNEHSRLPANRSPYQQRDLGIAVYATATEDVEGIFHKIGHAHCDHIHVDVVDESINPTAAPVQLQRLCEVRDLWPDHPVGLHVMSKTPHHWARQCWDYVDWILYPCDTPGLHSLIDESRQRGKKAGVVWHQSAPVLHLLPYFAHVDFVMVMGIARLGASGQSLNPKSLDVACLLEAMRQRHSFELMFDGGVKPSNASLIPARYLVSASGVLSADCPKSSAELLRRSCYSADSLQ